VGCWGRAGSAACSVRYLGRERCRGENTHLHAVRVPAQLELTPTRVSPLLKRNERRFVSFIMGRGARIECRWLLPIVAVTLDHGGVPFALDQLLVDRLPGLRLWIRATRKSLRAPSHGIVRYRRKTRAINKESLSLDSHARCVVRMNSILDNV